MVASIPWNLYIVVMYSRDLNNRKFGPIFFQIFLTITISGCYCLNIYAKLASGAGYFITTGKPCLIQELAMDYQTEQKMFRSMLLIKIVAQRYCAI